MKTALKKMNEYKSEPSAVDYLKFSYHVTDKIISTTSGEYLTLMKVRGRTHDCASESELVNWHRDLNNCLKSIGNEHVEVWGWLHHRFVEEYPGCIFENHFASEFNKSYQARFDDVPLMKNDIYIGVVYNPIGDIAQKAFSKFDKPSANDLREMQHGAIESLNEICDQILMSLDAYGVEPLGIYYRDGDGNVINDSSDEVEITEGDELDELGDFEEKVVKSRSGKFTYSSALEWLSFLVNGEFSIVPVCRNRVREYLAFNRVVTSKWGDIIQVRSEDKVSYQAGIEIRDYDSATEPGQLNYLMEAGFEFVLTQSFTCMSLMAAKGFLSRQEAALMESKDPAESQIIQIKRAADDVVSRRFIMGFHHCTLHTIADSAKKAQSYSRKARTLMTLCGITASSIGLASEAAYYARLPGNREYRPRPVPINSWNFWHFFSCHNFMSGKPKSNPWGAAVGLLKTRANTPLYFNWHPTPDSENSEGKRPAGHGIILGRTGAGKTTLLNALLTMSTKFKPRMVLYDKDRGMYPLVMALGGKYRVVRETEPTGFQPLQLDGTRANIAMVKRLIRLCAEITAQTVIPQQKVELLNNAVDHFMSNTLVPRHLRTFSNFVQQLPRPARMNTDQELSLYELLAPWCSGGEHGWLFDNPNDELDLSESDIFGFDLTDFITKPGLPTPLTRTPLMMYLFYRVRQSIDGSRHYIQVFDEFAQYLNDPLMETEIQKGLLTDRKRDGIYIFATQEPNAAIESRIGKTILQQCVTKILLENPDAIKEDYTKYLRLTDSEFDSLLSIPESSRQFLIKQAGQSTIAKLDLQGMEKEIKVLSGTPDNADRLDGILSSFGDDPKVWLPHYWNLAE